MINTPPGSSGPKRCSMIGMPLTDSPKTSLAGELGIVAAFRGDPSLLIRDDPDGAQPMIQSSNSEHSADAKFREMGRHLLAMISTLQRPLARRMLVDSTRGADDPHARVCLLRASASD